MTQGALTPLSKPRGRRKLRQAPALLASAAFHVFLFIFVFAQASGEMISGGQAAGGPIGPAFAVTLVSLQGPELAEHVRSEQIAGLKFRVPPDGSGPPLPTSRAADPLTRLAERLQTTSAATSGFRPKRPLLDDQGSPSPADARPSNSHGERREHASADVGGGDAASSGDLWNAIAPCWRRLDYRGQEAVTIQVSLDSRGQLRGPPTVIRNAAALLTERRLKSEANALAALEACIRRGSGRWTANSHQIEFPETP